MRSRICVALLMVGCWSASPARAQASGNPPETSGNPVVGGHALYRVNSVVDAVDASPGDGQCLTAAGQCTLRAAMMEAAAHVQQVATIRLPAGDYKLTIPPAPDGTVLSRSGALYNLWDTTIEGSGARSTIIDANHLDRAFVNGVDPNTGLAGLLGVHLTLDDLTVENGDSAKALVTPGAAGGGAIADFGWLTLHRVTLTGNHSNFGGAIMASELRANVLSTYVEIYDSTISNNVADTEAGGVRFDAGGMVVNSTFSGNKVLSSCCNATSYDGGPAGEGGGIDARGQGPVTILNSTIVGNHAVIGGGGVTMATYTGDATENLAYGPLRLENSIVAGNSSDRGPANCKRVGTEFISLGHNIASDDTCFLTAAGDKPKVDPRLAPIGDHGGPTDTFALLPGSPAIGAGDADCPTTDQRGDARPRACSIGATEAVLSSAGSVAPAAGKCHSRTRFIIRLRRELRTATVRVNGRRARTLSGRPLRAVIDLRGRHAGLAHVRITGRTRTGRTLVYERVFRICAA